MAKPRKIEKPEVEKTIPEAWAWLALGVIVIFYAAIRIRFLAIPFERDEGEYAYAGQLILQGIAPYKLVYNMKLPGIYYAYALVMAIFGQSVVGVHLGLLFVNVGSIVLMYLVGRRLFDRTVGLVTAAAFGFLTINRYVFGPQAHATHFLVILALGGLLLALNAVESGKLLHLFLAGVLLGLAVTMKQHGVFFVLLALLYVLSNDLAKSGMGAIGRMGLLAGASAMPFLLICLLMYASGVFDRFWFWTMSYASEYASRIDLAQGYEIFKHNTWMMIHPSLWMWILAGLGLALLWVDPDSRRKAKFTAGLFVFSFLTVCPGFLFREHYYVTWMPAVALLVGVFVGGGRNLILRFGLPAAVSTVPAIAFVLVLLGTIVSQSLFLFEAPIPTASRMMYGTNPWVETREIANYIKGRTRPEDKIAVLGSEPQLYFYADRKAATGYVYTYALMEPQDYATKMQQEMMREIETAKPKYLVMVAMPTSWLVGPDSDLTIINWQSKYATEHYNLVGVAYPVRAGSHSYDIAPRYLWGRQASTFLPQRGQEFIYVFERK